MSALLPVQRFGNGWVPSEHPPFPCPDGEGSPTLSDPIAPITRLLDSPPISYLVDTLLPARRIHLIVGPAGCGKTRFLIPMIDEWRNNKEVLGFASHPLPFGYLACDRSAESSRETISQMGYDPKSFNIRSMMDNDEALEPLAIERLFPSDLKVIFVEAFAALVMDGKLNDYHSILKFYRQCYKVIRRRNLTIIGSIHTPKAWEGEELIHAREKALGSVAWAACADTIIVVQPAEPKSHTCTRRILTIMPRNAPSFDLHMDFDDKGRLCVPQEDLAAEFLLEMELAKLPIGEAIETTRFLEIGRKHNIPVRTVERWLSKSVDTGKLERVRKGVYRRPRKN